MDAASAESPRLPQLQILRVEERSEVVNKMRSNYRYSLAVGWVKQKRPDVWSQIETLAQKKYPTKRKKMPQRHMDDVKLIKAKP
jgi:hypothetical protein